MSKGAYEFNSYAFHSFSEYPPYPPPTQAPFYTLKWLSQGWLKHHHHLYEENQNWFKGPLKMQTKKKKKNPNSFILEAIVSYYL